MEYFLDDSIGNINVLFVDDDQDFLDLLERKAESRNNLSPFTCDDPENTIDRLAEDSIDCIISDYRMGKMNGLELLEEVRENYPHLPFILFTGRGSEEVASEAMSKGATDYLMKDEGLNRFEVLENRAKNAVKNNRSEQAARRMLDRVTDAFFSLNEKWEFTYVNDEAERLLQRSKKELVGKEVWEAFPEAVDSGFEAKYRRAMEDQEPVHFEEYFPPLDTWFSVKAYPSETGISVYFRDVTDSRRRERQLRSRVKQQEATTELLRMALEEGEMLELQNAAVQMVAEKLGNDYAQILKLEDETNQLMLAAAHGVDMSEIGKNVVNGDKKYQESYTLTAKDPVVVEDFNIADFERSELLTFLNARSGISVIIGEYDNPWGILSTHSRESKRYSEDEVNFVQGIANVLASTLENQKQRLQLKEYKRAIDAVNDGIFMLDNSQRIIMANEAFKDISGYEEEQLIGQKHTIIDGEIPEGAKELETEIETQDGQKIEVKTRLASVELPDGTTGRVAVVRRED